MSSVLQVIGIMPLKKNVPRPRTADWKLKTCPECGRECWYPTNNAKRVLKLEEYTVPFCSNCDHRLDDCAGSFCPVCGSIIEERRRT